jgi:Fe-S-cluster-containing hydrogenase component 2
MTASEATSGQDVSRRDFLKQAGAGFVALGAIGLGTVNFIRPPQTPELPIASGVIAPDPALCIGCLTCEVVCSQVHRDHGLSDVPRIRIYNNGAVELDQALVSVYGDRGRFHQSPCLMCPEAECLRVCPANALVIEPKTGARIIDEQACIACGRCANACPFPATIESKATNQTVFGQQTRITYDAKKNVFTKCDLCHWRPEGPACVERCPVNVRIRQGIIKIDHLCLDLPQATRQHWNEQAIADRKFNA